MWIIIGLAALIVLIAVALWFRSRRMPLKWWEWLLGSLGVALSFFALQNYYASIAEFEPEAPRMFLVVFGLPALVLYLLGLLLPLGRYLLAMRRESRHREGEAAEAA
jgi:hypothetical protein